MSEGTENAEAQKPSKYKGFGQKVWRVRSQSGSSRSAVLEEIIETRQKSKTPEILYFRGLFLPMSL